MHRFSPSKIDGADEQKGTRKFACKKGQKKLNNEKVGRVGD